VFDLHPLIKPKTKFVDGSSNLHEVKYNENIIDDVILYATHANPKYMLPPSFSTCQIFCGPDIEEANSDSGWVSFKTPLGSYDILEELKRRRILHPTLFISHIDVSFKNVPLGLAGLDSLKFLILGDTHHQISPLEKVLSYFADQPYDIYLSDCKHHHDHFFKAINPSANIIFFPGLRNRFEAVKFVQEKFLTVSLMGGRRVDIHPLRKKLIDYLDGKGLPLFTERLPQYESAVVYSNSLINLNCSLNSEMNMRVMEVISAGGCLLTDRLSAETGLDACFEEGVHYLAYRNEAECLEKITYLLNNPKFALRIAAAGWLHYMENFSLEQRRRKMKDLMKVPKGSGSIPDFIKDERNLLRWIRVYERIQEQNKIGGVCEFEFHPPLFFLKWLKPLVRIEVRLPPIKLQEAIVDDEITFEVLSHAHLKVSLK
jgi:hypothetical protein